MVLAQQKGMFVFILRSFRDARAKFSLPNWKILGLLLSVRVRVASLKRFGAESESILLAIGLAQHV